MRKPLAMTIASFALVLMSASHAAEQSPDLHLSPQVRSLLQEEMREVARGTQTLAIALATADWKTLHDTAAKIRASYILNKQLSAAQKRELEHALPAGFKQLDPNSTCAHKSWRLLPKPATTNWPPSITRAWSKAARSAIQIMQRRASPALHPSRRRRTATEAW